VAGRIWLLTRFGNFNGNLDVPEAAVDRIPYAQVEKLIVLRQVNLLVHRDGKIRAATKYILRQSHRKLLGFVLYRAPVAIEPDGGDTQDDLMLPVNDSYRHCVDWHCVSDQEGN
jgi:hypothetical protein